MFGFLRRRLPSFNRPDRRAIFRYWDGTRTRAIDPLIVLQRFERHPDYREDVTPKLAESGDHDAQDLCFQVLCDVFEVKLFDGDSGLTVTELVQLQNTFGEFVEAVKKNIWSLPTPSPLTDAESTSSDSPEPTTSATSDSSSTETAPKSDAPTSPVEA